MQIYDVSCRREGGAVFFSGIVIARQLVMHEIKTYTISVINVIRSTAISIYFGIS